MIVLELQSDAERTYDNYYHLLMKDLYGSTIDENKKGYKKRTCKNNLSLRNLYTMVLEGLIFIAELLMIKKD